ncbi:FMN-linked oxidoreductase [Mycena rosella]|uniref:FMN-linked oxidoreductase n=1 Tax=Mycena rosella TaxID=1033263 RepID=A0AAD7DV70_MYCRO|nr:FMN-linked oxidoreductase [Mycena rosella]
MAPQLFQPIALGPISLKHRVVLAPLTRMKSDANHVPLLPLVKDYYAQRAGVPGTLQISESAIIAPKAGGLPNLPGIWTQTQITAWKEVVQAVHAKGSFIFMQLAALGRGAIREDPSFEIVSASDIPSAQGAEKPRPLSVAEIAEYVNFYTQAAKNAMEAGFDGVEIHNANACLLDQFLQDVSNNRTDAYGGSPKNRARFSLEVIKAVSNVVGEERTGIRFSPWSPFGGMGMADPIPTFSHIVSEIKRLHPNLAYIHLIEPRINADSHIEPSVENANQSNDFIRDIWGDRPLISAGGYTRDTAIQVTERPNALVAFGRMFIANPDLPVRLEKNIALHPYDRSTFYLPGQDVPTGYTDQPFATQA